jgi:hypothetical protein
MASDEAEGKDEVNVAESSKARGRGRKQLLSWFSWLSGCHGYSLYQMILFLQRKP